MNRTKFKGISKSKVTNLIVIQEISNGICGNVKLFTPEQYQKLKMFEKLIAKGEI